MAEYTGNISSTLVAATKVKGTGVYDLAGSRIGSVDHVMVDRERGCAIYAVMAFGESDAVGKKCHSLLSLPWMTMKYDAQKSGYVVNLDKKVLEDTSDEGEDSNAGWTPEYSGAWPAVSEKHRVARVRLS